MRSTPPGPFPTTAISLFLIWYSIFTAWLQWPSFRKLKATTIKASDFIFSIYTSKKMYWRCLVGNSSVQGQQGGLVGSQLAPNGIQYKSIERTKSQVKVETGFHSLAPARWDVAPLTQRDGGHPLCIVRRARDVTRSRLLLRKWSKTATEAEHVQTCPSVHTAGDGKKHRKRS